MEANERREPFQERHFTVPELAEMWNLSREFVRQVVQGEPGVTEWGSAAAGPAALPRAAGSNVGGGAPVHPGVGESGR